MANHPNRSSRYAPARPTDAELVVECGAALYGERWQSPLARALGLDLRTMQRLARAVRDGGDYPVGPAVMLNLRSLLRSHAIKLEQLARRV